MGSSFPPPPAGSSYGAVPTRARGAPLKIGIDQSVESDDTLVSFIDVS